jgi:hypothetical protein
MSSLSNILEDFRKSLHNDLDIAFNRGSQNLLTHLVEKLVSDNRRQTEVFIKAINDLKQEISSGGSVKIPEVYHTDVKLVDIISNCNISFYSTATYSAIPVFVLLGNRIINSTIKSIFNIHKWLTQYKYNSPLLGYQRVYSLGGFNMI